MKVMTYDFIVNHVFDLEKYPFMLSLMNDLYMVFVYI